jgi:hypothetical protein
MCCSHFLFILLGMHQRDIPKWDLRCVDYLKSLEEQETTGYIDVRNPENTDTERPYLLASLFWKKDVIQKQQLSFGKECLI